MSLSSDKSSYSIVWQMPFRFTYFAVNDTLNDVNPYQSERSLRGLFSKFLCAQAAAIAAGYVSYPFDTVRRKMQIHAAGGKPITTWEACAELWADGGWFAGAGWNAWRTCAAALALILYGEVKEMLK